MNSFRRQRTAPARRATVRAFCAAALALAGVASLAPAPAFASTTHVFTLNFEPLVGSQNFSKPRSVAADAAGNLYVIGDGSCQEVTKWDVNGTPVNFSAFGTNSTACGSTFSSGPQIAVAPPGSLGGTAGNIYVTSQAGIEIYAADGTHTGLLTEAAGSVFKEGPCGVAVDSAGRVYVGDKSGERIARFAPSANPPTNADYDAQITGVGKVCNVAAASHGDVSASTASIVDEGKLKSVDGPLTKYPAAQFGGAGSGTQITAESAGVGVDPSNDDVYVTEPVSDQIAQFDSAGNLLVKFGEGHLSEPRGVAVDTAGDVFVSSRNGFNPGWVSIFAATLPPEPPGVAEERATDVNTTNVILRAQLDPNREATTYHFEYTDHADFLANGFANAISIPTPEASAGSGNAALPVLQPITGLEPDTTYDFRLVATNGTGTTEGAGASFTTFPGAPVFGPCPNDASRIGPSVALPNCRAYEQVSPLEKGGFDSDYGLAIARPDGEAVVYASSGSFAGSFAGSFPGAYRATRTTGWLADSLQPKTDPTDDPSGKVFAVSGDLSKQLVATNAALNPGDPGGDNRATNFYVHDSLDGSYQYVATAHTIATTLGGQTDNLTGENYIGGASYDGSHFVFTTKNPLGTTPDYPVVTSYGQHLYDFDTITGQLSYVGILPNDTVVSSEPAGAGDNPGMRAPVTYHPISDDGERIYWTNSGRLYLRHGGQTTLVSEKQSDGSAQVATLWGTSADGSLAYLTSAGKLTEDASPAGTDLYRYDDNAAAGEKLTDLTPDSVDAGGAGVLRVLGVSEDGAYLYFIANGALAPGAPVGNCLGAAGSNCSLYVWHEGDTRLIGALATNVAQLSVFFPNDLWRVSPSGRYLGFLFGDQLTGPHPQPPSPFKQAYLYDYEADTLDCASCLPGNTAPSADVTLRTRTFIGFNKRSLKDYAEGGLSHNVTDAGQFFFQSKDRLTSTDSNGKQDVYEYENGKTYLISTGRDANDSYFGDATPSGDDVFFFTREKGLVGADQDNLMDLYDARVHGGLGGATSSPACEGDACITPPAAPDDPTPASAAYRGAGNLAPKAGTPRCRKGRKLRRGRCVKAKKKHKRSGHRAAHANRGGSK